MQALIFVHKRDVEEATEIAVKLAGPQAQNTFDVPYDNNWFVCCWTMKSDLYNKLKEAGLCVTDYKKEKDKEVQNEVDKQVAKGKIVSKDKVKINYKKILDNIDKTKISKDNNIDNTIKK